MKTVGQYIEAKQLSPEGYNTINNDQEIESTYQTKAGDEMIVFGMGEGQIIVPVGGTSTFQSMEISEFLALPNESDWKKV